MHFVTSLDCLIFLWENGLNAGSFEGFPAPPVRPDFNYRHWHELIRDQTSRSTPRVPPLAQKIYHKGDPDVTRRKIRDRDVRQVRTAIGWGCFFILNSI
jgi:hypothetical protein